MKKLIIFLTMLTACRSQSIIPPGDPGKITAHLQLIELFYGEEDTLKCLAYSLTNESDYDYYLPLAGLNGNIKFSYSRTDTNLYDKWKLRDFYTIFNGKYSSSVDTIGQYIYTHLIRPQIKDSSALWGKKKDEMQVELSTERIRQIFKATSTLTKEEKKRIKDYYNTYLAVWPVLLKAGETMQIAVSMDFKQAIRLYQTQGSAMYLENYWLGRNLPNRNNETYIYFEYEPISILKKPTFIYWTDQDEGEYALLDWDKIPKIWYYDPVPYPKYKSYYPYLGDITCSDTIVIRSGYLLE